MGRPIQPFYRSSRSGAGHGIGLAIVRRIADRFEWQVELESTPGSGTVAVLRFPAAIPVDPSLQHAGPSLTIPARGT